MQKEKEKLEFEEWLWWKSRWILENQGSRRREKRVKGEREEGRYEGRKGRKRFGKALFFFYGEDFLEGLARRSRGKGDGSKGGIDDNVEGIVVPPYWRSSPCNKTKIDQ